MDIYQQPFLERNSAQEEHLSRNIYTQQKADKIRNMPVKIT
jgi:hypothetical protein